LRKLDADKGTVSALAFSADGTSIIAGCFDGTLRVWDAATGQERSRIQGEGSRIERMALSPDGETVAAWSSDNFQKIGLWHAGTGKALRSLEVVPEQPGVRAALSALGFSHDGKTLYAASGNHLALLRWDVIQGVVLPGIGKHDGGLNGFAISSDDRSAAVVTADSTLYLWELATGQAPPDRHASSGKTQALRRP
jgi:WD40 repeat protein